MSRPTLGILGGMGPAAGAEFFRLFTAAWPADRDQDHPRVILLSEPAIPPRVEALLHGGTDPTDALRAELLRLCSWGADLLAVPCNTAQAFIRRFQAELPVPVVDIVSATVAEAARQAPGGAWLAATAATRASGLYQAEARRCGYHLFEPGKTGQAQLDHIIARVKAGDIKGGAQVMRQVAIRLRAQHCIPLLFACTELPLVYQAAGNSHGDAISSLEALAVRCTQRLQLAHGLQRTRR